MSEKYGEYKVIKYVKTKYKQRYYLIKFKNTGYEYVASLTSIRRNLVKDPYCPYIYNVGYLGGIKRKGNEKLYSIWIHMLGRCYNKKEKYYHNYGGIGVSVDKRWHCFECFVEDVKQLDGYNDIDLMNGVIQLDKDKRQLNTPREKRIYSKETCCWIGRLENTKLSMDYRTQYKKFRAFSPSGEIFEDKNQSEFARKNELTTTCITKCLKGKQKQHKGWRFEYIED